ncbi:MAG TPA: DMT family transporter [Gemmatimonadales bacterium]|jgi:transporter family-2 protein
MIPALLLALLAGLLLPLQAGINSHLRSTLGHPLVATLVSFLIGTVAIAAVMLGLRVSVPAAGFRTGPWWGWTGGILGAVYVLVTVVVAPRLGAATMIATIIAGQMLASLLLDHYGVAGYAPHAVNAWRVAGAILVIAGVVLIQRN